MLSVETSGEYELVGHSIAERRGTTAARVVAVREATDEREVPGESLDAVAPSGVEAAVPVLDLEESARNELLGSTAPGTVSAPIAVEGGFALFELISAEQEGGALSAPRCAVCHARRSRGGLCPAPNPCPKPTP